MHHGECGAEPVERRFGKCGSPQRPGRVPLRGGGAVRMRSTARAVRGRSSTLGLVEIETVIVHPRAPARAFSPGGSAPAPARRPPRAAARPRGAGAARVRPRCPFRLPFERHA